MNEMQVFRNEQFGWDLRSISIQGNPCFWSKDVVDILKLANPRSSMALLDEDEKGVHIMDTPGGKQNVNYVTEAGLYTLVLKSRRPEAKLFRRWITHEVIPSIRQTGGYIMGEEKMTDDELLSSALIIANNKLEQRGMRIKALEAQIEADKPKVEFAERISVSKGTVTIKQFAALLCQKGYRTGEIRMFEELRQDGFLLTNGSYKNEPAQKYLEMRIFEVRTYDYTKGMTNYFGRQPVITAKGIEYLLDYYMRKHGLMPLLSIHRKPLIPRPTLKQLKAGHSNS